MKEKVYHVIVLLGLIVSVSYNVSQYNSNELLGKRVVQLTSELNIAKSSIKTQKAARPTVVSCANNQADYINALINMEKQYKMPNGILQNIAYHESRYNPNAVSHAGAIGIMQIHPRWHKTVNPYNPMSLLSMVLVI